MPKTEDPRYHLSADEEKEWAQVKMETPTKDDWTYLLELIIMYQRRRIANARKLSPVRTHDVPPTA